VKDLRRQHKAAQQSHAAMDEGYPFMVTEARRVILSFKFLNFFEIAILLVLIYNEFFCLLLSYNRFYFRHLMLRGARLEEGVLLELYLQHQWGVVEWLVEIVVAMRLLVVLGLVLRLRLLIRYILTLIIRRLTLCGG
jgi:hypothetical protein